MAVVSSGKARSGNHWLKGVLGEVAWAIARTRATDLSAQFRRIARGRGVSKAIVAVAHSVLVIVDHLLRTGQSYADLGPDDANRLDADRLQRHHVQRLRELGFEVTLTPVPIAAQPGFS